MIKQRALLKERPLRLCLLSDLEVYGGIALLVDAELVVLTGEHGVKQYAHYGGYGKAGEAYAADPDGARLYVIPMASTIIRAAIMTLRLLVKSTLFSTTLRTPTAEIMP